MPPEDKGEKANAANGQFDFILKPQTQPKASGPGFRNKALMVLGLVVVVGMILSVIAVIATSGKGDSKQQLLDLAATQQEIIRVSTNANINAKGPTAKTLAANTAATVQSEQNDLVIYLKSKHIKVNPKLLAAKKSAATDAAFAEAAQNNKYDAAYIDYLAVNSAVYQKNMSQLYTNAKSLKLRSILFDANASIDILGSTAKALNG